LALRIGLQLFGADSGGLRGGLGIEQLAAGLRRIVTCRQAGDRALRHDGHSGQSRHASRADPRRFVHHPAR
jgi:hypothetical protein